MATISFSLDDKITLSDEDMKKLGTLKGKTWTAKLTEKDVNGDKISPTIKWKDEMLGKLAALKLSGGGIKYWKEKGEFAGKISEPGDYDLVITANRTRIKLSYEITAPVVAKREPPKIRYGSDKIAKACEDKKFQAKILSIALTEGSDKGHGPVDFLDGALHAHVTQQHGIAWFWRGKVMEVIAVGKKNNANKAQQQGGKGPALGTCEYDWYHSLKWT